MSGKPTIYVTSAEGYLRQLAKAHADEAELYEFARSIGCTIIHDEVQCTTADQTELLDRKMKEMGYGIK